MIVGLFELGLDVFGDPNILYFVCSVVVLLVEWLQCNQSIVVNKPN